MTAPTDRGEERPALDDTGLVKRLRADAETIRSADAYEGFGSDGLPDRLDEAADRIEALTTEVERLNGALDHLEVLAKEGRYSSEMLMSMPPMNAVAYRLKEILDRARSLSRHDGEGKANRPALPAEGE